MRSFIPCFEWIVAGDQFEHHKAKTVPIDTEPVGVFHNYLRCQILGGADEALSHFTIFFAQTLFAQTKICKSDVTLAVNKNVLWFDIPIDDALVMKVFKRKEGLRDVELSALFSELL